MSYIVNSTKVYHSPNQTILSIQATHINVLVLISNVNLVHPETCALALQTDSLLACKACCWLQKNLATIQRLDSHPSHHHHHYRSHTHSPFPQSTHTCARVGASFGCQSELREPSELFCCSIQQYLRFPLTFTSNTHLHSDAHIHIPALIAQENISLYKDKTN